MRLALLALGLLLAVPAAAACEGLSPGDNVIADGASCTLAYLVADPTGLYFMTAGHCIAEGSRASNPEVGDFGTGAFTFLTGQSANGAGSPGNDFALIRIDPSKYEALNPKMCGWNAPTGVFRDTVTSGDVRHYGHGLLLGETETTRPREGTNLQFAGGESFRWLGAGVSGDSGSAVAAADGRALGILTHLSVGPADQTTNAGTHMDRAFQLATDAGYQLRLVLTGEDPRTILAQMQGPAPTVPPVPGESGETPTQGNGTQEPGSEPASGNQTPPSSSNPTPTPTSGGGDTLDAARTDDANGGKSIPAPAPLSIALVVLAVALVRRFRR